MLSLTCRTWTLILGFFLLTLTPKSWAQASSSSTGGVERYLSYATYGIVAGAALGAGTMLLGKGGKKNLAVGASLGLYTGLLLGAWRSYEGQLKRGSKTDESPKPNYNRSNPLGIGALDDDGLSSRSKSAYTHYPILQYTQGWRVGYGLQFP